MPAGMRQLGEDERLELIDALKAKWDEARDPIWDTRYDLRLDLRYAAEIRAPGPCSPERSRAGPQVNRKYQSTSVLSLASLDTIGKVRHLGGTSHSPRRILAISALLATISAISDRDLGD